MPGCEPEGIYLLPEEIWEIIIELAVGGTCSLERYYDPSFKFGWPYSFESPGFEKSLLKRTRTIQPIALVCRLFRTYSTKYIFEVVLLSESSSASSLADALTQRSNQSDHRIAKCIKTLFVVDQSIYEKTDVVTSFTKALAQIIKCCTTLRCLVLTRPGGEHETRDKNMRNITRLLPTYVTHIDFNSPLGYTGAWKTKSLWTTSSDSYLQKLRIRGSITNGDSMKEYNFSALTHLCVDNHIRNSVRLIPFWKMDNLTHLYMNRVQTDTSQEIIAFWRKPKPSIVFLHLGSQSFITLDLAELILSGLPELQSLEYYHEDILPAWKRERLPQTLVNVSIALSGLYLPPSVEHVRHQIEEFLNPQLKRTIVIIMDVEEPPEVRSELVRSLRHLFIQQGSSCPILFRVLQLMPDW